MQSYICLSFNVHVTVLFRVTTEYYVCKVLEFGFLEYSGNPIDSRLKLHQLDDVCVLWVFVQDIDVAAQLVWLGHAVYVDAAQSSEPAPDLQVNEAAR